MKPGLVIAAHRLATMEAVRHPPTACRSRPIARRQVVFNAAISLSALQAPTADEASKAIQEDRRNQADSIRSAVGICMSLKPPNLQRNQVTAIRSEAVILVEGTIDKKPLVKATSADGSRC